MTPPHGEPQRQFAQRRDLSHVLGIVVRPADVAALRAGQGPDVDRLAWLGTALLAVLLARYEASRGPAPAPQPGRLDPLRAQLDHQPPGDALLAAAVAAGHRSAGWSGVRAVVTRLLDPAVGPEPPLPRAFNPAQAAYAGQAVLDAAATLLLVAREPDAVPADLAPRRASLTVMPDPAELGRVLVVRGEQAAIQAALPQLRGR